MFLGKLTLDGHHGHVTIKLVDFELFKKSFRSLISKVQVSNKGGKGGK